MKNWVWIAAAVALFVLARVAVTTWAPRYQYDHTNIGPSSLLTRIDRTNGRVEILYPGDGWRDATAPRPADWQ